MKKKTKKVKRIKPVNPYLTGEDILILREQNSKPKKKNTCDEHEDGA